MDLLPKLIAVESKMTEQTNGSVHRRMIDAEARAVAQQIIQTLVGPDQKIIDLERFYEALVQELKTD
jgi:hypothetical protein